jgi:hypothetical protein
MEKVKIKVSLSMLWRHIEVQLHSFLISAVDGSGWLISLPGRFTPGKELDYPFSRRMGGPQKQSGRLWRREFSCPYLDLNPWPTSSLRSRYTDCTTTRSFLATEEGKCATGGSLETRVKIVLLVAVQREMTVKWDIPVGVTVIMLSQTNVGKVIKHSLIIDTVGRVA